MIKTERYIFLDFLRIFATAAVIVLHVAAQNWYTTDVNGFIWKTFNVYDSMVRWCVPVFVMISGTLFLKREIKIGVIYKKYIMRLVIAYFVWTSITSYFDGGTLEIHIQHIITGQYHMWFIPMIIGLYMCIPITKEIIKNKKVMLYFLTISLIFNFLIPEIVVLINDFGNKKVIEYTSIINGEILNLNLHLVLGYVSFFILGYVINEIELNRKQRSVIYILGVLGVIFTIALDLIVALKTQTYCDHYYGNLTINILIESIAVFTWFKYNQLKLKKIYPLVIKLSKYSFGAYLVHALVIEQLNIKFGISTLSWNPIIAVPFVTAMVFLISFSISAILNNIPILRKYIV